MDRHARTILAVAGGVLGLNAGIATAHDISGPCTLKLSNDARMAAAAELKKNRQCIARHVGDVTPCIDTIGPHTAALLGKLMSDDESHCAALPRWSYAGGAAIGAAARAAANAIAHDLFGPVVSVSAAADAMRCQKEVSRHAGKLALRRWLELWKCQRRGADAMGHGIDIAQLCLGGQSGPQPDPRGTLRARYEMLEEKSQQWCADARVPFGVFAGACGGRTDSAGFAECVADRVDCRVCLALRVTYGLAGAALDCDRFDDDVVNGSCNAECADCGWCGDGVVQAPRGEQCDDRNQRNGDGCSAGCIVEHCGDGRLDTARGEQCDDGGNVDDDGCSAGCQREPCDDEGCRTTTRRVRGCGDGVLQRELGERCDDGNSEDNDGCASYCQIEHCGDGYRQAGEDCDPGFGIPGCSARCEREYCGDGVVQEALNEQCDDGNAEPSDGCDECVSAGAALCGNGRRDAGEDCDDGRFNGYGMCRSDCRWCSAAEVNAPIPLPVPKDQLNDLQDTGLFRDVANPSQGVEPGVRIFEPQYPLWSDAGPAQHGLKTRWIFLPHCKPIDNTMQDRWTFPLGTKLWKEFKFEGKRVETRMMQKVAAAPDASSWEYIAFRWVYDERTGAVVRVEKVPDGGAQEGDPNVEAGALQVLQSTLVASQFEPAAIDLALGRGPDAHWRGGQKRIDRADAGHAIPALWECELCHNRGGDPVLAFDYLQLSTDRDPNSPNNKSADDDPLAGVEHVDLATLQRQRLVTQYEQLITNPRIAARGAAESAASERAILGYFHGNCGHCHNPQGPAGFTQLRLRFDTAKNTAGAHDAITTPTIERGRPFETKIYKRMVSRDRYRQMPPIATHVQDADALRLLAQWINTIPPR